MDRRSFPRWRIGCRELNEDEVDGHRAINDGDSGVEYGSVRPIAPKGRPSPTGSSSGSEGEPGPGPVATRGRLRGISQREWDYCTSSGDVLGVPTKYLGLLPAVLGHAKRLDECHKVFSAWGDAQTVADSRCGGWQGGGRGFSDGDCPCNAFFHALWSGMMVASLGEKKARFFARLREGNDDEIRAGDSPSLAFNQRSMDLHNDFLGISIAVNLSDQGLRGKDFRQRLIGKVATSVNLWAVSRRGRLVVLPSGENVVSRG